MSNNNTNNSNTHTHTFIERETSMRHTQAHTCTNEMRAESEEERTRKKKNCRDQPKQLEALGKKEMIFGKPSQANKQAASIRIQCTQRHTNSPKTCVAVRVSRNSNKINKYIYTLAHINFTLNTHRKIYRMRTSIAFCVYYFRCERVRD